MNCQLCPRLCCFRAENQKKYPNYKNAPVSSFGSVDSEYLIVGLAPGLHGANQTGRPFTNDYAGDILYPTLKKLGFARGNYQKKADDGFELINVRITNAVRCVPPQNIVTTEEVAMCRAFLQAEINSMPNLKAIMTLGVVSHNAVLKVLGLTLSKYKFVHGAIHNIGNLKITNSYHTSRYNINTKVLSLEMFEEVCQSRFFANV